MKAWHFLKADFRTDRGNLFVKQGKTLRVEPPVELCLKGLHFSLKALDALDYAPGPVIQYVEVPDDSILGVGKGVAVSRKCLWMYDASSVLHEFACRRAESVLRLYNIKDERSWNVIHVQREWLAGRATNVELRKARAASREVAGDAAQDAAMGVLWDVVRGVSWEAARETARGVARDEMATELESLLKAGSHQER